MDIQEQLREASKATLSLGALPDERICLVLRDTARALRERMPEVLHANQEDLARMDPANPKYDRLGLTWERLAGMAGAM